MRYITLTIAITALFTSSCDFDKYSFIKDSSSTTTESIGLGDASNKPVFDSNQFDSIQNSGDATIFTTDGKPLTTESGTVCAQNELLCENGCVPNDMMNCGTCGHDCTALPHVIGSVVCSDTGECLISDESCAPGWAHCSSQADHGCETDITQPANCGSCRNDCSQGSAQFCAPQEAASSDRPTYACSSECPEHAPTLCGDNSCVDTSTSTNHCGECGNSCPQTEHGEAICVEGKCGLECSTGYHPCDDSCLSDTSTDSCGTSCEPCQVPANADPACDGTNCSYTCKEEFLSCDGLCLSNDAKNCGSCGHDCTNLPHVSGNVDCDETGACIVPKESCAPGYAHCTSNPDHGCETDLSSSETCGSCAGTCPESAPICSLAAGSTTEQPVYECATGCNNPDAPDLCSGSCVNKLTNAINCGECGKVCPTVSNGQPDCVNGVCAITCNNGYHLCDDSCLDNDSPDSCGTRCSPCPSGSNARATCNNGTCGFECSFASYLKCSDGSCVPNDDDNCGTCGISCAPRQRCVDNNCICDSISCSDGCCDGSGRCQTPDTSNCGIAGSNCVSCTAPANGVAVCSSGSCDFTCRSGFHRCGDNCADNDSVTQCGSSCQECPDPEGGSPVCDSGVCTVTCDSGWFKSGNTCISSYLYVSTTGSDSNSGTSILYPLRSFKRAMQIAVSGQTVRFSAGTYGSATGDDFSQTIPDEVNLARQGTTGTVVFLSNGTGSLNFAGSGNINDINIGYFLRPFGVASGTHTFNNIYAYDAAGSAVVSGNASVTCQKCSFSGAPTSTEMLLVQDSASLTFGGNMTATYSECSSRDIAGIHVTDSADLVFTGGTFSGTWTAQSYSQIHVDSSGDIDITSGQFYSDCGASFFSVGVRQSSAALEVNSSIFGGTIYVEPIGSIRIRNSSFSGNQGLYFSNHDGHPVVDLGTASSSGNNDFSDTNSNAIMYMSPYDITINARGNTWVPNEQGADANGKYASGTVMAGSINGRNFLLMAGVINL